VAYLAELDDDFRQQVRYSYSGNVLRFWPKIAGTGNVQVTGTPTCEIRAPNDSPDDTAIATPTITVTTDSSGDMCSIPIDASSTTIYDYGTHYQCTISWVYSSKTYLSTIYFDVVRDPWLPDISLNDLVEEVADLGARLLAQAVRIKAARTAEQHASILGRKAWGDVSQWLRQRAEGDGVDLLPHLIADREALRRVTVAQAIHRAYDAEGGAEGSESAINAERWAKRARDRFSGMGPLRYASTTTRAATTSLTGFGVIRVERTWG
jgi:hypothetical protein